MTSDSRRQKRNLIRTAIGFVLYLFAVPALPFIAAGTLDWPMAWLYAALVLVATFGSRLILLKKSPDTLRERARFVSCEGTKPWDRILGPIVGFYGPAATLTVAGLDQRFAWSTVAPSLWQYVAALAIAAAYGLATWAMVVNRYFSAVARIQEDRGQEVVTAGPYGIVRHPGYAGALVATLALPVMLDALWAYVPALGLVVALVARTSLEDRMLRDELAGYAAYAEETRYRLVPGVW